MTIYYDGLENWCDKALVTWKNWDILDKKQSVVKVKQNKGNLDNTNINQNKYKKKNQDGEKL